MDKYDAFIGKVLDGRYKILGLVGVGGMAFVLKAEDLAMNRIVAIKVLNDQYNGDEQAEKRFINESKAVAMLSSKHIVGIYDVAIYPDIKYIVMEFLDGITLKDYMNKKEKLPWKEACNYALQILRALEHVHSKGVVHRDIKPQNIMLLQTGEIKITDFGIAKTPNMPAITITDRAIGTVYYISPEQAAGKETSYGSDLYSVGIMLYEMVTGELPFVAESPVTIAMMQINDKPKNPRELCEDLPEGVAQIILKAIEKSPDNRFADAHSMLKAVDYVIKNPDVVFANDDGFAKSDDAVVDVDMDENDELGDDLNRKNDKPKKKKSLKRKLKEKQKNSLFPVITGVFFAFLIVVITTVGYVGIKWVPKLFESEDIPDFNVRDLIGLVYTDDLKSELESQNYLVTVEEVNAPGEGFGKIINQDPKVGLRRINGNICRITLTVNRSPDQLTVPDVKYKSATDADRILRSYNLSSKIEYVVDLYASEGQVVRTEPPIGENVAAGGKVTLYVAKGTGNTTAKLMPDVVGLHIEEAIKKLEDAYYRYEIERVESDEPRNTVVYQSIDPYTGGHNAWTVVKLEISLQSNLVKVPMLLGETLESAESMITNAGFVVGNIYYDPDSTQPIGTVISQSIEGDTEALLGTEIDITVSGAGVVYADPVPNLVGLTSMEAQALAVDAGYTVRIEEVGSSQPAGTVIDQSLTADSTGYAVNTEIVIYVAKEQETVTMISVIGNTVGEAEQLLQYLGLQLGTVTYDSTSPHPVGTIVEQSIVAGSVVSEGTALNVVVSGEQPNG